MIKNDIAKNKKDLHFSQNWNYKLNSKCFTTLRISNNYNIGETVNIILFKQLLFHAEIVGKKCFNLNDINDFISYIDVGVNAAECKQLIQNLYKGKKFDWKTQKLYFYLLRKQID